MPRNAKNPSYVRRQLRRKAKEIRRIPVAICIRHRPDPRLALRPESPDSDEPDFRLVQRAVNEERPPPLQENIVSSTTPIPERGPVNWDPRIPDLVDRAFFVIDPLLEDIPPESRRPPSASSEAFDAEFESTQKSIANIETIIPAFRLALVQLAVGEDKSVNIAKAVSYIERAKEQNAEVVVLPECFNSPYGTQHFKKYAETIPDGETSLALSEAAKKLSIFVVGGTIPERDNGALYNTATVWDPQGNLVAKHRKMHLFDIDIKGKITFFESETLSPGDSLTTFNVKDFKIGLGICYDIRFEEMARLYRNMGCHVLLYPAAFNMTTGPLHWSLLQRSRANDNQCYVACASPARDKQSGYVAWAHTQLTSPWAEVLHDLDVSEGFVVADIDMSVIEEVRSQIPVFKQRRTDLYDTIIKQ